VRKRELAGQSIATVGLGDVSFKISSKRHRDPAQTLRRVHEALEAGIDLIDVAPEDDTERAVADAVRILRVRDRAIIATRLPELTELPGGMPTRDRMLERLPLRYVLERVDSVLRATKLDALPLVQLPLRASWRDSTAWPELVGNCQRLIREGKVLRWGAIAIEPAIAEETWLASIAVDFSLCQRAGVPLLRAAKVPVLARYPLAGGALAGTIGPGVMLAMHDDRRMLGAKELEAIAVGVAKLASRVKREPIAARSCDAARAITETEKRPPNVVATTIAELALRYAIDRGTIPLPRVHKPDDLMELVLCAAAEPLPEALIAKIDELFPDPVEETDEEK
jgi:aryl-alcohol dehydrogenase-like predicted oxidoreductase